MSTVTNCKPLKTSIRSVYTAVINSDMKNALKLTAIFNLSDAGENESKFSIVTSEDFAHYKGI